MRCVGIKKVSHWGECETERTSGCDRQLFVFLRLRRTEHGGLKMRFQFRKNDVGNVAIVLDLDEPTIALLEQFTEPRTHAHVHVVAFRERAAFAIEPSLAVRLGHAAVTETLEARHLVRIEHEHLVSFGQIQRVCGELDLPG